METQEVHNEEIQVKGLLIKIVVTMDFTEQNRYSVICKAYDRDDKPVWRTELLDENGGVATFSTPAAAVEKAKKVLTKQF